MAPFPTLFYRGILYYGRNRKFVFERNDKFMPQVLWHVAKKFQLVSNIFGHCLFSIGCDYLHIRHIQPKTRWRPPKPEVQVSRVLLDVETKLQQLEPCFWSHTGWQTLPPLRITLPDTRNKMAAHF